MSTLQPQQNCPTVSVINFGPYHAAADIIGHLPQARPKLKQSADLGSVDLDDLTGVPADIVNTVSEHMSHVAPALWAGQWSSEKRDDGRPVYPSQSEADLALARQIAPKLATFGISGPLLLQTTKAVFDRSALAQRPKWGRADYCQRTIQSACQGVVATSLRRPTP